METDGDGHRFEMLCAYAARKHWCWKIGCGTCSAMHFRRALWRLATAGREPAGSSVVGSWPVAVQRGAIAQVESAPAERIVRTSPFPDGLGYLGLVLAITGEAEGGGTPPDACVGAAACDAGAVGA